MEFKIKYIRDDDIEYEAIRLLNEFHPKYDIPIPIEEIVEIQMKIDIVPMRLKSTFSVEAFISSDLKCIYVDEYCMENYLFRYRYSLAHEIGHKILHNDAYSSVNISSPQEWLDFQNAVDPQQITYAEVQANKFASYLLMPKDALITTTAEVIKFYQGQGIDMIELERQHNYSTLCEYMAEKISRKFMVSPESCRYRLQNGFQSISDFI